MTGVIRPYIRPLMQIGPNPPTDALHFGGCWFTHVEVLSRNESPYITPVSEISPEEQSRFVYKTEYPHSDGYS